MIYPLLYTLAWYHIKRNYCSMLYSSYVPRNFDVLTQDRIRNCKILINRLCFDTKPNSDTECAGFGFGISDQTWMYDVVAKTLRQLSCRYLKIYGRNKSIAVTISRIYGNFTAKNIKFLHVLFCRQRNFLHILEDSQFTWNLIEF